MTVFLIKKFYLLFYKYYSVLDKYLFSSKTLRKFQKKCFQVFHQIKSNVCLVSVIMARQNDVQLLLTTPNMQNTCFGWKMQFQSYLIYFFCCCSNSVRIYRRKAQLRQRFLLIFPVYRFLVHEVFVCLRFTWIELKCK